MAHIDADCSRGLSRPALTQADVGQHSGLPAADKMLSSSPVDDVGARIRFHRLRGSRGVGIQSNTEDTPSQKGRAHGRRPARRGSTGAKERKRHICAGGHRGHRRTSVVISPTFSACTAASNGACISPGPKVPTSPAVAAGVVAAARRSMSQAAVSEKPTQCGATKGRSAREREEEGW